MLKKMVLTLILVVAVMIAAHIVYRPPSLEGRAVSEAVEASASTALGAAALASASRQNGESGVVPLLDGPDAFAARVALIRAAQVALDVQYYIWQRDATGLILLNELRQAAERGVRVRLLLDDNGIDGLDIDLAAFDALPTAEVRLFNPFILRALKPLGYAFDFVRLNRRMHNKSLTADGAVGIVGGRNIGDTYFSFGTGMQFIDTDVMVAGPAAAAIGGEFDRYWESGSAHPIDRIVDDRGQSTLDKLVADAGQAEDSAEGRLYAERLRQSNVVSRMAAGQLDLEWVKVTLVSDDPAKGLGKAKNRDLLFPQLMALLAKPSRSVDLVSAYFVPGRKFTDALDRLARQGVRVRVLTNSQAATDVAVVHSAYVKYRPDLLRAGVELYELKPEYAARDEHNTHILTGSSSASLHSKTLAVDGERIFIGSFNFDPRSLLLNTEMGVLIDSPRMASGLSAAYSERFRIESYVPKLTADGAMVWDEVGADGKTTSYQEEPGTTVLSRFFLWFLSLLPIEWLL